MSFSNFIKIVKDLKESKIPDKVRPDPDTGSWVSLKDLKVLLELAYLDSEAKFLDDSIDIFITNDELPTVVDKYKNMDQDFNKSANVIIFIADKLTKGLYREKKLNSLKFILDEKGTTL